MGSCANSALQNQSRPRQATPLKYFYRPRPKVLLKPLSAIASKFSSLVATVLSRQKIPFHAMQIIHPDPTCARSVLATRIISAGLLTSHHGKGNSCQTVLQSGTCWQPAAPGNIEGRARAIVESIRPRSRNGLPGAEIRRLNLARISIMSIWLNDAPPAGWSERV